MADIKQITLPGNDTPYNIKDASAVANVTKSGTSLIISKRDGTSTTLENVGGGTEYSAGDGIDLTGDAITNTGVRSVATGTTNGTIKVDTNGTSADVAVKGLGSLAYKSSLSASDVGALATSLKGANSGLAELDSSGKVPAAQLPTHVTKVSTGVGLTGGDITTTGTVKVKLKSETALTNDSAAATETAGKVYPVAVDKSGYLAVNVPWTDNNTTALGSMTGTLGVSHGGTGATTLTGIVKGNGTSAMSAASASDVVSLIGNNAVARATADASGNNIANTYLKTALKGANSGVAELDANGKVPSSQLPSYVDDVLEYNGQTNFPATGETGKIYVDTSNNKTYRWSGSAYVEISASLALGKTSSTAAAGNHVHSYTPEGTVSTPTISVKTAGSTTTVNSITAVGTLPSLSTTTYTVPNVTGVGAVPTTEDIACDDITAWSAGTVPTLGTAIAADDITAWSAGTAPSLTVTNQTVITGTSVSNEVLSFTTATNGSASGWSAGTVPSLSYTARSIPNVTSVGTAPSLSYTARTVKSVKSVGSTPTLGTAFSIKGVNTWAAGTLPTKGDNVTVKTGDAAYQATQLTFTGTTKNTAVIA